MLVLFQFVSVHIALGFFDQQTPVTTRTNATVQKTTPKAKPPAKGFPISIKIPSIRVNAVVQPVGILPDGSMGVPGRPRDVAWYMLGSKPGEKGSAVMAGHVNWWYGVTGVFARLSTLQKGDRITVQDDRGVTTTFAVRETRAFGPKDDATDVFRSTDGKAHLNLVTCGGVWDRAVGMYSKRIVVFADKVE